jgi:hypothetical protein
MYSGNNMLITNSSTNPTGRDVGLNSDLSGKGSRQIAYAKKDHVWLKPVSQIRLCGTMFTHSNSNYNTDRFLTHPSQYIIH